MDIKITSPESCFLAWCLPLTKEEYDFSVAQGDKRDFIRSQLASTGYPAEAYWQEIYSHVAADFENLLGEIKRNGVTVFQNFKCSDLVRINGSEVVTVFAHHSEKKDFIELNDGLFSAREFVNALPSLYHGIYDLTACNSVRLRNVIRGKYGNQVISFDTTLPATTMLVFYKNIIEILATYEINYIDCYAKMVDDLRKLLEKRNDTGR